MYPWAADCADYAYLKYGLLLISGGVPKSKLCQPTQCDSHGTPALPVMKTGLTSGTTIGWLNGLKTLVHYSYYDITFTSFETTIVSYGSHGAFSGAGNLDAAILNRKA